MIDDIMIYEQVNKMKGGALPMPGMAAARVKRSTFEVKDYSDVSQQAIASCGLLRLATIYC